LFLPDETLDLASNNAVAAVAQALHFVLMQLLLYVHQLFILQYFMLQQLPHDDSSASSAAACKSRM
jgi:hypothetical protein